MHGYIYDVFLHQKPYEKDVIQIEHCLTDAGLKGPIVRLSIVNSVKHAVDELLKKGVTTIVAVGGDNLFSSLVDQVAEQQGMILGTIPLGTHGMLAHQFGVPYGVEACKTLSARLVRPVRLAKINSQYFIHSIAIIDPRTKLIFDEKYSLTATSEEAQISILNYSETNEVGERQQLLSATITPTSEKKLFKKAKPFDPTSLTALKIEIKEPRGIQLLVDGQKVITSPAIVTTATTSIQVIMGKDRQIR
jgi:hypothetical protein